MALDNINNITSHSKLSQLLFKNTLGTFRYIEPGIKDITYHHDNDAQYPIWVHDLEHQLVTLRQNTALINKVTSLLCSVLLICDTWQYIIKESWYQWCIEIRHQRVISLVMYWTFAGSWRSENAFPKSGPGPI